MKSGLIIIVVCGMLTIGAGIGLCETPPTPKAVTVAECVKARQDAYKLQEIVVQTLMTKPELKEEDCTKAFSYLQMASFEIVNSIYVQRKLMEEIDRSA